MLFIMLVRVLRVKNFGAYAFYYSVVQIITVPAMPKQAAAFGEGDGRLTARGN